MKISITGLDGVKKAFSSYKKTKTDELRDEVNTAALNVDRGAKKRAKVETGRMRSSIHIIPAKSTDSSFPYQDREGHTFQGATGESTSDLEAEVVTNVDYAPKQESINPFMFPSWEEERPKHIERVKDILRRL